MEEKKEAIRTIRYDVQGIEIPTVLLIYELSNGKWYGRIDSMPIYVNHRKANGGKGLMELVGDGTTTKELNSQGEVYEALYNQLRMVYDYILREQIVEVK